MRVFTQFCLFLYVSFACSDQETKLSNDIEDILAVAGNNEEELRKVLNHYVESSEHEKFEAAQFLIKGLPYHNYLFSEKLALFDTIFSYASHANKYKVSETWDSLITVHGDLRSSLEPVSDLKSIKATQLIENIDLAFLIWNKQMWKENYDQELFFEYVLPYRSQSEILEKFRAPLIEKYQWINDTLSSDNDIFDVYKLIYLDRKNASRVSILFDYPVQIGSTDLFKVQRGNCSEEANLDIMILRANGIPSAIDYVPQWANRGGSHLWSVVLDSAGQKHSIYVEEISEEWNSSDTDKDIADPGPDELISASRFIWRSPGEIYLPKHISTIYDKKVAKVYRKTFSPQKDLIDLQMSLNHIPNNFKNVCVLDVTDQYMETSNIEIPVQDSSIPFAFLCHWDITGWNPVAFGKKMNNTYQFNKVGHGALFLPAVLEGGEIKPIGEPFVLRENGDPQYFHIGEVESVIITRKYPLFGNTLMHFNRMYGGRFEGANFSDFRDSVLLKTIDFTPYYFTEVSVENSRKFQYLRYVPKDKYHQASIAELEFYTTNKDGLFEELQGNVISRYRRGYNKAFDKDIGTSYFGFVAEDWLGLELHQPASVSKIRFCPRNDSNIIMPEMDYELFYWRSDKWNSLGRKIAKKNELIFTQVPKGALLWLHCHSGGKEERPFVYQDGKQIWW